MEIEYEDADDVSDADVVRASRTDPERFAAVFDRHAVAVYDPDTGTPLETRVGKAATTLPELGWVDLLPQPNPLTAPARDHARTARVPAERARELRTTTR